MLAEVCSTKWSTPKRIFPRRTYQKYPVTYGANFCGYASVTFGLNWSI